MHIQRDPSQADRLWNCITDGLPFLLMVNNFSLMGLQVHVDYLEAGADIIITASYQVLLLRLIPIVQSQFHTCSNIQILWTGHYSRFRVKRLF